jgi:choline kinase
MQQPTLVILAAGMASRYGSMKQVQGFGPAGETIMDYSIYDAIRAGFGKVVFIIRKDFAEPFKNSFEPKLAGKIKTEYVYQDMDAHLGAYKDQVPAERTKPWGTAHAVLCTKDAVQEPFAVINADDFYGKDAFAKACQFLTTGVSNERFAIVGYELSKTLSENGSVSRGVCTINDAGNLTAVNERTKIYREDGAIVYEEEDTKHTLAADTKVSMNFWCFAPSVYALSESLFADFLSARISDPKSEFYITTVGDAFIRQGGVISVIPTSAQWFGVTYKEDAPGVQASLNTLIEAGEYPANLWA